jgi:hypothetical protein
VAVSNRPEQLTHVIESFRRQDYANRELVFVANSDDFDRERVEAELEGLPASALFISSSATLADCLNEAIRHANGEYIAKFDDDDDYGQHYLTDVMLTFEYSGAAVAGKQTYYAYLHGSDQSVLRFPGREFRHTNRVVGGTLVFNRQAVAALPFQPVRRGTDSLFLKDCVDAGLRVFSADRFNFVQHRFPDPNRHTWTINDEEFLSSCTRVGSGYRREVMFL